MHKCNSTHLFLGLGFINGGTDFKCQRNLNIVLRAINEKHNSKALTTFPVGGCHCPTQIFFANFLFGLSNRKASVAIRGGDVGDVSKSVSTVRTA